MKWNKLTIETTTAAEDMLSYELSEMGMEGVEIEDHVPLSEEDRKIMYVDLLPDEIAPDDGKARISCYVDEKEDLQAVIARGSYHLLHFCFCCLRFDKSVQNGITASFAHMPVMHGRCPVRCFCRYYGNMARRYFLHHKKEKRAKRS